MQTKQKKQKKKHPILHALLQSQIHQVQEIKQSEIFYLQLKNHDQLKQKTLRISLHINYQKNYQLLVLYLAIHKRNNIVKYKSISISQDNKIAIQMEKGLKYDINKRWYGDSYKQNISVQQKFKFMVDVCKGLISLTQLKIVHFDLEMRNIIKKESFKIIDFDRAFLAGVGETYPKYRNYLSGSQLQTIQKQLYSNFEQIVVKQYQLFLKDQLNQDNMFFALSQYDFVQNILGKSQNKGLKEVVQQLIKALNKNIQLIHSKQFGRLLFDLFSVQDLQQIQQFRQTLRNSQNKTNEKLQVMIDSLKNSNPVKVYSLSLFYSQLTYTQHKQESKMTKYRLGDNELISYIYQKQQIQFWKDNSTKPKQIVQKQMKRVLMRNYPSRWYSELFQRSVNLQAKKIVQSSISISSSISSSYSSEMGGRYCQQIKLKSLFPSFQINLKQIQSNILQSKTSSESLILINSLSNRSIKQINHPRLNSLQELNTKSTKIITKNITQNYFIFQLLLAKYIQNIQSNNLLSPTQFGYNQYQTAIQLYYKPYVNEFQQCLNFRDRVDSIWNKGFTNVIKFIKHISRAVLELQKYGLFHPQINIENIMNHKKQVNDGSHKTYYKITNLQKCYFLSFHYDLTDEQQILLNSNKLVFYHYFNPQKHIHQELPNFNYIFKNLNEFQIEMLQQTSKYFINPNDLNFIIYNKDTVQTNKVLLMFQYFRLQFHKMHSIQLGRVMQTIFGYYTQAIRSAGKFHSPFIPNLSAFIPIYWKQKWKNSKKLMIELLNDLQDRITVQSFYLQFDRLFPTCDITNHQDQLILYYFKEEQKRQDLCNQCIQECKEINVKFFCIDHEKPISYYQPNKQFIEEFGKSYYCQVCCQSLPPNHQVRLIDQTDLSQCKYICMDLSCSECLISQRNKKQNHKNHPVISIQEFEEFYDETDTRNSIQTIEQCSAKGRAVANHLDKITKDYCRKRQILFQSLTHFKGEQASHCERLYQLLYPKNQHLNHLFSNEGINEFWKASKMMYYIHNKSKEQQFKLVSIEGFIQYCNFRFSELASTANEKIQQILKSVYQQFQHDIFSKQVHKKVDQFVKEKYREVVNKQPEGSIKPIHFTQIPDKYNQVVKSLTIQKSQMKVKEYLGMRNRQRFQFDQYCQKRIKLNNQWICLISKQNQNLTLTQSNFRQENNKRQHQRSQKVFHYMDQYQIYSNKLIQCIQIQQKAIQKIKRERYSQNDFLQLNQIAFYGKVEAFKHEKNAIKEIIQQLRQIQNESNCLKNINFDQNKQEVKNLYSEIIKKRKTIMTSLTQHNAIIKHKVLRAFHIQFLHCPSSLPTQMNMIYQFKNLQKLYFTKNNNPIFVQKFDRQYFLTGEILQNLLKNCSNLRQIHIRQGYIELFPCLSKLIQIKNEPNFAFYANTENTIAKKKEVLKLAQLMNKIKFHFPCVSIQLRKDIDEQEKDAISQIIKKMTELKLQLYGPIKNRLTQELLSQIIQQEYLKVTSLSLHKIKIRKMSSILTQFAKKGRIQKLTLVSCLDYSEQFISYCRGSLKTVIIKGSLTIQVPNQFIASLLSCQKIQHIQFKNLTFNASNLTFKDIKQLKYLSFQFCPGLTDNLLLSINRKAVKSITSLTIFQCQQISQASIDILSKMSELKYLTLSSSLIYKQLIYKYFIQDLDLSLMINYFKKQVKSGLQLPAQLLPNLVNLDCRHFRNILNTLRICIYFLFSLQGNYQNNKRLNVGKERFMWNKLIDFIQLPNQYYQTLMKQQHHTGFFIQEWYSAYHYLKKTHQKFGNIQQLRHRKEGKLYIIHNSQYQNKRPTKNIDCAYQTQSILLPFLPISFNFNKISPKQVIGFFDPQSLKISIQQNYDNLIIVSGSPICQGHSLFVPFAKQNHPQLLTNKLLKITIQLASVIPQFKFGYNSQGAASSVNHFHIQIIDFTKIVESNILSFQNLQGKNLVEYKQTKLKVQYFKWENACFIKINSQYTLMKVKQQTVTLMMKMIQVLIKFSIPHNLIITNTQTIYLILRNFANNYVKFGWLQYCGVIIAAQPQFQTLKQQKINQQFQQLSFHNKYNQIIQTIKSILS